MAIDDTATHSDTIRRRLRWGAPLLVAGVVTAGVVVATAAPSDAVPTLPKKTAAQLLTAVQTKPDPTFSGVVRETANLGLPSLPGEMSSASLSWQTFITGSHSAKVWVDGPLKQRIALQGELSEADVVHNGADVWTYTSQSNSVTHSTLPAKQAQRVPEAQHSYDPAQAARDLLAKVGPSTSVTVDTSRYVAKRAAYTLVIRPKDANSTVRKITVAIDAKKYLPLRLQVFGAGSSPAFSLGFTSISYATPAASTFTFHKPAGATVSTDPTGMRSDGRHGDHRLAHPAKLGARSKDPIAAGPKATRHDSRPTVLGSGWTSVVELSASAVTSGPGKLDGLLNSATTPVGSTGDRLLHTALVNVVLRADGKAFVGAVKPAYLEHVAATAH
jgi:outer membrane lipoprotein-sorting protein